jgi:hypothetical protein
MFYVYLLASKPYGTLCVGTTSDLARRIWEHKNKLVPALPNGTASIGWFGLRPRFSGRRASPRETTQGMETRLENQSA